MSELRYILSLTLLAAALLPTRAAAQDSVDGSAYILQPGFTIQTDGYAAPYAGHNGKHILFSKGQQIVGVDPQTSLIRWQEGELKNLRSITDLSDRLLMVGEHIVMRDKGRGKRLWDFPLNCFGPGQCNADVLASTDDKLLVGGFGQVYNMIQLIGKADGKEIWPSWVSTCGIQEAGIVSDSVVLVCTSEHPLVQRVDFQSRRTLFTAPSPVRWFKADDAWFSDAFVYVTGKVAGKRKLYVFSTEDGTLAGKFGVKEGLDPSTLGFLISTTAARFVPWQNEDDELTMWGIDVKTGKSVWKSVHHSGRIVGQTGSTLSLLEIRNSRWVATGLDLAGGKTTFRFPVPMEEPRALMLDNLELVWSPLSLRFLVVDVPAGKVRYLGTFPQAVDARPDKAYFSRLEDTFITLLDNGVTVYSLNAVQSRVDQLKAMLDAGNGKAALEIYETLAPFRRTLPEAADAFEQISAFFWLQARMQLVQSDKPAAVAAVSRLLEDAAGWNSVDFQRNFQRIAGHALQMGLSDTSSSAADDQLKAILELVIKFAPTAAGPDTTLYAGVAISVADSLAGTAQEYSASELVASLQEDNRYTAIVQGSPFWTRFKVEEVGTGLELANQAFLEGDFQVCADLLREMSASPVASDLFGSTFDPWLDAAGLYLLTPDLQAMKLPDVMKALLKRFASGKKSLLMQTRKDICLRTCDFAEKFCPGRCVSPQDCAKSAAGCRTGCRRGKRQWKMPRFSVSPTSTRFFQCR